MQQAAGSWQPLAGSAAGRKRQSGSLGSNSHWRRGLIVALAVDDRETRIAGIAWIGIAQFAAIESHAAIRMEDARVCARAAEAG
jgi:hypothetical protein